MCEAVINTPVTSGVISDLMTSVAWSYEYVLLLSVRAAFALSIWKKAGEWASKTKRYFVSLMFCDVRV